MSAGIKANNDGSAAIQVGGTDYITISSAGAVAIPVSLTVGGVPAGGNYALVAYTSPATWDATAKITAGLKAIKVTVVGAGGNGGAVSSPTSGSGGGGGGGGGGAAIEYIPAPSIPGPVAVTAGPGTNSFGAFCSATAGAVGTTVAALNGSGGAGGVGSGGTFNCNGNGGSAGGNGAGGNGGGSLFGGGAQAIGLQGNGTTNGAAGSNYGGGGSGGTRLATAVTGSGGAGAPGIVIVEEFY